MSEPMDKTNISNLDREEKGKSRGRGRNVKPQPSLKKMNSLSNIKEDFFIEN